VNLIPMLSPEQRRALLSYERDCRSDADCEPPLGCFRNEFSKYRVTVHRDGRHEAMQ